MPRKLRPISLASGSDRPAFVDLIRYAARLLNGSPDVMLRQAVRPFALKVRLYLASAEERCRKEDRVLSFFGHGSRLIFDLRVEGTYILPRVRPGRESIEASTCLEAMWETK